MVDEKRCLDNKISAVHVEKQIGLNDQMETDQISFEKPKMSYKKLISEYKCPLCIEFIGADAIELSGT